MQTITATVVQARCTYADGRPCSEWPIVLGFRVGPCGKCKEIPTVDTDAPAYVIEVPMLDEYRPR